MKTSLFGPCGIYCGACGADDCAGCKSDIIDDTITNCKFRICSMQKNLEFCCDCNEYPCPGLTGFMNDQWPHHHTVKDNNEFIKTHGKDKWLEQQKAIWQCPGCGAEIMWYQKKCKCDLDIDAWDLPEDNNLF